MLVNQQIVPFEICISARSIDPFQIVEQNVGAFFISVVDKDA